MRAISCSTTVDPDSIALDFDHAFIVDGVCHAMVFQLTLDIEGFRRSEEVAVSSGALDAFIAQLANVQATNADRAILHSRDCVRSDPGRFELTVEPHGKRGYLLVRVMLAWSEWHAFRGGFIAEPAGLSGWLAEFKDIQERKQPAIDFCGEWRTHLPLPSRLRPPKLV